MTFQEQYNPSLYDFMSATLSGPWNTAPLDTQWKVVDTCFGKTLAFQGTNVNWGDGWLYASTHDCAIDVQNFLPNPRREWRPRGLTRLDAIIDDIVRDSGPIDRAGGWSLGGMISRRAAARAGVPYITFGAPRTLLPTDAPDPDSIDVILRTDAVTRLLYPGFVRKASAVYIGPFGRLRFVDHSINVYLHALEDFVL